MTKRRPYLGARIITIWRPSIFGSCSTLATARIDLDLVEQLHAELLVAHLAAAEAQGDLDLVAFLEEAVHGLASLRSRDGRCSAAA